MKESKELCSADLYIETADGSAISFHSLPDAQKKCIAENIMKNYAAILGFTVDLKNDSKSKHKTQTPPSQK